MRKYCKHYLPAVSLGFRRSSSARSGARGPPSYFILTRQSSESTLNRFRPKRSTVLFLALHSKLAHLTPSSIRDAGLVALHRPGHRASFYSFRTKASAVAEGKKNNLNIWTKTIPNVDLHLLLRQQDSNTPARWWTRQAVGQQHNNNTAATYVLEVRRTIAQLLLVNRAGRELLHLSTWFPNPSTERDGSS